MPGKAQQSGPKTVKNTVLAPHSLDEVPHKKHNPALQFQDHEPVKPPPCTPAFADEGYRFGTNVVSELQQSQQLHRQAKQVCQHTSLHGVSITKPGAQVLHMFKAVGEPAASQASITTSSKC